MISEVCGSNPVISKIYIEHKCCLCTAAANSIEKMKIKKNGKIGKSLFAKEAKLNRAL